MVALGNSFLSASSMSRTEIEPNALPGRAGFEHEVERQLVDAAREFLGGVALGGLAFGALGFQAVDALERDEA